jgi:hypothetical protein
MLLPLLDRGCSPWLVSGIASTYLSAVAVAAAADGGGAAELRRKWFVDNSRCASEDMGTSGSGQLHLTQACSVFMIVAGGAAVGLLAAAGEMLYYRGLYTREPTCIGLGAAPESGLNLIKNFSKLLVTAGFQRANAQPAVLSAGARGVSFYSCIKTCCCSATVCTCRVTLSHELRTAPLLCFCGLLQACLL